MATSAKDTAKISIEVEARTEAAVASFAQLQSQTKKASTEVAKLDQTMSASTRTMEQNRARIENTTERFAAFDRAVKAANTSTAASSAAFSKSGAAAMAFSATINSAKEGSLGFVKATMAAASAFGPWGIAIGVAGNALVSWIGEQQEATRAAEEHTAAIKKQAREMAAEEARRRSREAQEKREAHENWRETMIQDKRIATEITPELESLEETFAQYGRGANMSAYIAEENRLLIEQALIRGDLDEMARLKRQEKLRLLELQGKELEGEKKVTREKEKQREFDPDRRLKGGIDLRSGAQIRGDERAAEEFERERQLAETARIAGQMQRDAIDYTEDAEKYRENARQERFERELARIHAEQDAREEAAEAFMRGGEMVADTAAGIAAAYLTSGDLSARGFRKAVGQFTAAEAIRLGVVAIRESVLGGVAASNPFTAALAAGHFAAAGQATAGAAVLGGIAAGLGVAGGAGSSINVAGYDGSAFGPGVEAANDRPSVSNSQKDTTPISESQMQQQNAANSGSPGGGSGNVINIYGLSVLGALDDQSARTIAKGIKRVVDTNGRITG